MKKKTNRFLTAFTTLTMLLGSYSPQLTFAADEDTGVNVSENDVVEVSQDDPDETVPETENDKEEYIEYEIKDNWYEDYEYTLSGNEIWLRHSLGNLYERYQEQTTEEWKYYSITIPSSASISGNEYKTILAPDEHGVGKFDSFWDNDAFAIGKIGFEKGVKLAEDASNLFKNLKNLSELDMSNLDTVGVTNLTNLFYGCENLETIDVSVIDTSKVTNIQGIFENCKALKSLDLTGFDTSQVTNASYMFSYCESLESLDVSHMNTSNMTDISNMFEFCSEIKTLDITGFDTSQVTNASCMFSYCGSLESLDVSHMNTSNMTEIWGMFQHCTSLKTLDVSNFDTSNVQSFANLFRGCREMESIDVSGFDTSKGTSFSTMFASCEKLKSIDLSNFDTSNATGIAYMFMHCTSLENVNLSSFDTSKVSNLASMFYKCSSLKKLDLSSFDCRNVTYTKTMMDGMTSLAEIHLSRYTLKEFSFPPSLKKVIYDGSKEEWEELGNTIPEGATIVYGSEEVEVSSITLTPSALSLNVGDFGMITATLTPQIATEKDIVWSCSDVEIAIVSGNGLTASVNALKAGNATITAAIGKVSANALVSVSENSSEDITPVTSVKLDRESVSLIPGDVNNGTFEVHATVYPDNATYKDLTWSSSDEAVATVSGNGATAIITAVKKGKAIIFATASNGISAGIDVMVIDKDSDDAEGPFHTVKFLQEDYTGTIIEYTELGSILVAEGKCVRPELIPVVADLENAAFVGWELGQAPYTAWDCTIPVFEDIKLVAVFADRSDKGWSALDGQRILEKNADNYLVKGQKLSLDPSITWETSDKKTLMVNKNIVTAKKAGKAVLRDKTNNEEFSVVITVPTMTKKKYSLICGQSEKVAFDYNEIGYDVFWLSSNPDVVKVADGTIYAISKGSATITAYVNGKAYNATVKVKAAESKKKYELSSKTAEIYPGQTLQLMGTDSFVMKDVFWEEYGEWTWMNTNITKNGKYAYMVIGPIKITPDGKISFLPQCTYNYGPTELKIKGWHKDDAYDEEKWYVFNLKICAPPEGIIHVNAGSTKTVKIDKVTSSKAQWVVQDARIATVDAKGKVKGIKPGYTILKCSYNGFTYNTRIYVEDPTLKTDSKLSTKKSAYILNLKKGERYVIKSEGCSQPLIFKTNKDNVAFADEYAVVYARENGTAKLKARLNGKNITITINVTE